VKQALISVVGLALLSSCSQTDTASRNKARANLNHVRGSLTWSQYEPSTQLWTIFGDSSVGRFKLIARCKEHIANDKDVSRGPGVCSHAVGDTLKNNMFVGPEKDGFVYISVENKLLLATRVVGHEKYTDLYDVVSSSRIAG
jgi:hypothetical protein